MVDVSSNLAPGESGLGTLIAFSAEGLWMGNSAFHAQMRVFAPSEAAFVPESVVKHQVDL